MKRLFVVTLLVMVMSACTQTPVTAPEQLAAGNTVATLAKPSACDPTYGPTSSRWSFPSFSTRWPLTAPNVVIWYWGGIYPNDTRVHDFLYGEAVLNGDLDCWTTQPFKMSVTFRKRGADAANVSPKLDIRDESSRLLARLTPTTSFTTVTVEGLPAGVGKLRFLFNPGTIDLTKRHADVNIDVSSVTVEAVE